MKGDHEVVIAIMASIICFFVGVSVSSGIMISDGFFSSVYWTLIGLVGSGYIAVVVVRHQEFRQARDNTARAFIDSMNGSLTHFEDSPAKFSFHHSAEERETYQREYRLSRMYFVDNGYEKIEEVLFHIYRFDWSTTSDAEGKDALELQNNIINNYQYIKAIPFPMRGYYPWPLYKVYVRNSH